MINVEALMDIVKAKNTNITELSKVCNMSAPTLYRQLKNDAITIRTAMILKDALNIPNKKAKEIFFN